MWSTCGTEDKNVGWHCGGLMQKRLRGAAAKRDVV